MLSRKISRTRLSLTQILFHDLSLRRLLNRSNNLIKLFFFLHSPYINFHFLLDFFFFFFFHRLYSVIVKDLFFYYMVPSIFPIFISHYSFLPFCIQQSFFIFEPLQFISKLKFFDSIRMFLF